jgi:hypothetical protein
MTAKEFVSRLAPLQLERLALIFNYLADHEHELRLEGGGRINDNLDCAAFHRELAAACKNSEDSHAPRSGFNVDFCPDCGHVHVDDSECGFPTGAGGRTACRCERKVTA